MLTPTGAGITEDGVIGKVLILLLRYDADSEVLVALQILTADGATLCWTTLRLSRTPR